MLIATLFEQDQKSKRLNQPFRTPGGPKKFAVYVKNDKGNVVKVNFGDSTGLSIKRDQPERRKAFRARHNCSDPGPKTKARYWSCQMWRGDKSVSQQLNDAVDEVTINGDLIEEMGPNERDVANKAGKILAHDFKEWAKDRYKNQRPTFNQYLKDIAKSPTWRTDWFDKFMGAVEKSFDKHIGVTESETPLGKMLPFPQFVDELGKLLAAQQVGWQRSKRGDQMFLFSAPNDNSYYSMVMVENAGNSWVKYGHGVVPPNEPVEMIEQGELPLTLASVHEIAERATDLYHNQYGDYDEDEL